MQTSDFITKYGEATFRHSDELFACLRSGACVLDTSSDGDHSLPGSHFLRIYQIRTQMLREREPRSPHAAAIIADAEALADELARHSDEPCGVWCFSRPPHYTFSVYEALRSHRVLGCIRAVDRRLVDDQTWERLWQSAGAA